MRLFGWLLIAASLVLLGRDAVRWIEGRGFGPAPLGQVWFDLDRFSLNLVQAVVERYVASWLWQDVVAPLLLMPAWAVSAATGATLIAAAHIAAAWRLNSRGP
ncbi:MAG: hypothetical protein FJX69_13625 [Alphaproteobacteria bacterium]|nr:hypothetical protein [Alphaproteobacteria bacterium]